jgi:hypothetical protein
MTKTLKPPSEVFEECEICRKNHNFFIYGHPKIRKESFDSFYYKNCPVYIAKPLQNEKTLDTQPETDKGTDSDNQTPKE